MRFPIELLKKCWFIAGPTASGKSDVAIELAQLINGEVLSLDSMAIYRGMDIGTAKPDQKQQAIVQHHLIDLVDPHEDYSVADYIAEAASTCQRLVTANRIPIFAGGTGLYLRSLLRGVFEGPPADWDYRAELNEIAKPEGSDHLHALLQSVDPQSAAKLHPNDERRIVRALEVLKVTGQPLSSQQREEPLSESDRPNCVVWLSPQRDWLYNRINTRVDRMIELGLVDEVQKLLAHSPPISRTARQGLGYKEIIEHIEGNATIEDAVETVKTRTRQFAKRQHTWFRNLVECTELPIQVDSDAAKIAQQLRDLYAQ